MLLGVIADDFTGASDIASTLAKGGMRTRLFIGAAAITSDCEAGVVALKSRSIDPHDAVAQSLDALAGLRAAGAGQFVLKYCSTFDSTATGNIGPVAEALADALDARGVVVCPAFPANGRTVYQGHLFVNDRLLSESGMERHPLTPMTDPDIRRWLARQTRSAPGHLPLATVRQGPEVLQRALAACSEQLIVVDAVDDQDLATIGMACANAPLLTGGSGIALGLPANFASSGRLGGQANRFRPQTGPAVILSGSCSAATLEQVRIYCANHPSYALDVTRLVEGEPVADAVERFLLSNNDAPLIYSSASADEVRKLQIRFGVERTATAIESFFGMLAKLAVETGFARIVAAGGETSGAVVSALAANSLDVGPEIASGVPALSTVIAGRPLALALKSGNFGGPDFFEHAVAVLGGQA